MRFRRSTSALAVIVIVAMIATLVSCSTSSPKVATNPPSGVNAGPDGKPAGRPRQRRD